MKERTIRSGACMILDVEDRRRQVRRREEFDIVIDGL